MPLTVPTQRNSSKSPTSPKRSIAESEKVNVSGIKYAFASPQKNVYVSATLLLLTVLAVLTRFYNLNYPDQVVFDEVHFGKFASYYLRGTFFFDVHPPLGKLIVALSGWLKGYDGSYLFDKIGDVYAEHNVPFVFMRSFPAFFGAAMVPLVFKILQETGHSLHASMLGASMVLFDTGLTTQCRYILLDSFMIFFDIFSVFCWIKFYQQRHRPFCAKWWLWMLVSGVAISLTTSVKMVGLFIVALVGVSTIIDLWRIIDIRRGISDWECFKHFTGRVIGFIAVPFAVYLLWFAIHFSLLTKSGPGDTFMSAEFQSTLENNRFNQDSRSVYYNSTITILHYQTNAYLHSHAHNYQLRYDDGRVSSAGQQVTGYPHNDTNNDWRIIPEDGKVTVGKKQPRMVRHGDVIQLLHVTTGKYLLTHDVASPLTKTHMEVTCVDLNDAAFAARRQETLFKLEFIEAHEQAKNMSTIDTKFRLIHVNTKVGINSYKSKLPEWGFGQQEVNGNKNSNEDTTAWIIDAVKGPYDIVARKAMQNKGPSFLSKFIEQQSVMLRENSALVSSHPFQSFPISWPVLSRGISYWVKEPDQQVYLIGNPFIWWLGSFGVALVSALIVIDLIALRRGIDDLDFQTRRRLQFIGGFFVLGWALHYFPFFIMGRVLFLHHYMPALIFSFMAVANAYDFIFKYSHANTRNIVLIILIATFASVFVYFAPFTYGWPLTQEAVLARKWLKTWDFAFSLKKD
ncbi:hypothetical protein MP228_005419 [Amoeboaphelidium protococcarum]|nr:hypothetical protein MP228_005419 [Amoeboaphelidium protococcarum]